jgi:hypothetical protein
MMVLDHWDPIQGGRRFARTQQHEVYGESGSLLDCFAERSAVTGDALVRISLAGYLVDHP